LLRRALTFSLSEQNHRTILTSAFCWECSRYGRGFVVDAGRDDHGRKGDGDKATCLWRYGRALFDWFMRDRKEQHLKEAISSCTQAIELWGEHDLLCALCYNDLGNALSHEFLEIGSSEADAKSTDCYLEGIACLEQYGANGTGRMAMLGLHAAVPEVRSSDGDQVPS
jgi:hypothetical protein